MSDDESYLIAPNLHRGKRNFEHIPQLGIKEDGVMKNFSKVAAFLAGMGLIVPQVPAGEITRAPQAVVKPVSNHVSNVVLADGRTLQGRVVQGDGQALDGVKVELWRGNQIVASVVTDEEGQFSIPNTANGLYIVRSHTGTQVVRAWDQDSAPPNAVSAATLTADSNVVRGQSGADGSTLLFTAVGVAVVTAGIVGGVAYSNQQKEAKKDRQQTP